MKRMSSLCSAIAIGLGISATWGCGSTSDTLDRSGDQKGSVTAGDLTGSSDPASSPGTSGTSKALSRLNGCVTDVGTGDPKLGLAGAGTLASATAVQIVALGDAGKLSVLAKGALDAQGAYSVEIPTNETLVIAQAVNAAGEVLGSVIVGASAKEAGKLLVAEPISTESSIAAKVLIELSSCQSDCAATSPTDLTTMIDAELAAAISSVVKTGGAAELDDIVRALAKATVAAELTRTAALSETGAELDATARAAARIAASASFQASLSASLGAKATAVVFAAIHASAKLEARATAAAVNEIVKLSDCGQAVIDATAKACAELIVDVDAAASLEGLASARADFVAAISASASANARGIVSGTLDTATDTLLASMAKTLSASAELRAKLEAELKTATSALAVANLCVAADGSTSSAAAAKVAATTELVIDAYAKFTAGVRALGPDLTCMTTAEAKRVTDELALAESMLCLP